MVNKCGARRSSFRSKNSTGTEEKEERPLRRDTVVQLQPASTTPQQTTTPALQPGNEPMPTPRPTQQPVATPAPAPVNTQHPGPATTAPANTTVSRVAPSATPTTKPTTTPATKNTSLYVTIDGLKVRKEPGLKSETIDQLKLYDQVEFLNKRTDWTQEISLGLEKVTDHWVKVKTKRGKEGWVFGAGVNYYKEKRKGVLE
jgi:Bacterial SH3 domain